MKIRLVPMELEHYRTAVGDSAPWLSDLALTARAYQHGGPAFAAFWGDALLAVAGVLVVWPGVGQAWAVWTPAGRAHPGIVHRAIRRELGRIIVQHELRRVHADVVRDFAVARAWMGRLGFRKESTMEAYGPTGEDFTRYVWLRRSAP